MMTTFDPHAERPWSAEEDKQLRNAVFQEKEQNRPVKWDTIAASLPRRSKKECRKRWHHTMMEAVRKCQWKPEEDERLSGAVQKFGKNWISVAQVVMTRNDNECMRRWNELQSQSTNANSSNSPSNLWTFEEFNRVQHPHRASVSSSASSADFHDISPYSTPYSAALSEPMVDELLRDIGQISPRSSHFENMDLDPTGVHSISPSATIDPRQANMHQEHLDAFIDFDAERSGNSFEARHTPSDGHQYDSGDWSWFDNMVTTPGGRPQYHNHHNGHPAGLGGFLVDTHPSELAHDSPGALDSSPSSYPSSRSGSLTPSMHQPETMDFYSLSNQNFLPSKPGAVGARVVIVCKSNDSRTLSSLDNIMRTLKANGHSVIQESQPIGGNDYLCGSLALDDVLQDLC